MRLLELDAHLRRRRIERCASGPSPTCSVVHAEPQDHEHHERVESVVDADGVAFLCPTCFTKNGGRVGTHRVVCWRPRVPPGVPPMPGRWELVGTSVDDLTLVAARPSVRIEGGCGAHFYIERGAVLPA